MARGRAVSEDGLCSLAVPGRLALSAQRHAEAAEFGVCRWGFTSSRVLISVPFARSLYNTTSCHQA